VKNAIPSREIPLVGISDDLQQEGNAAKVYEFLDRSPLGMYVDGVQQKFDVLLHFIDGRLDWFEGRCVGPQCLSGRSELAGGVDSANLPSAQHQVGLKIPFEAAKHVTNSLPGRVLLLFIHVQTHVLRVEQLHGAHHVIHSTETVLIVEFLQDWLKREGKKEEHDGVATTGIVRTLEQPQCVSTRKIY
jgi:hypothetical protein